MYKIQSSRWMQFRRQVCVHTQLKLLMKRKMQQLLQFTLRRMMNNIREHRDRKVGWQDSMPSQTPSSREQLCSKKEELGLALGVIQTGTKKSEKNQTLQHSVNDPSNGPRAWEKMARKPAWTLHKNCKWYDPHDRRSNIEFSVIWTCLLKFNDVENQSPAVLSRWVFCAKKSFTRMNGIQVKPSYLIKNGRTIESRSDNHILVWQATDHQTRSLGDRKQRQLVGDHVSKVETDWPEWLRRIKKEDRQIRQMSLQLAWKNHRQHFLLPRMLQQNLLRTEAGGKTIHSLIFRKDPNLRSTQTHESNESAMHKKSSRSGGQN